MYAFLSRLTGGYANCDLEKYNHDGTILQAAWSRPRPLCHSTSSIAATVRADLRLRRRSRLHRRHSKVRRPTLQPVRPVESVSQRALLAERTMGPGIPFAVGSGGSVAAGAGRYSNFGCNVCYGSGILNTNLSISITASSSTREFR